MTATIADIAWPGPRPLSFEDVEAGVQARTLIGREKELAELLHVCQTYAVVEITAASGVGKTSFVAASKPHLEMGGAEVVKARPWMDVLGAYDALDDHITATSDALPLYCLALGRSPCEDSAKLPEMLKALGGERPLVCIFDQLDELLRYRHALGRNLLELVGRTAAISGVPHMVVARSEFRDALRPVEVREAPTWHMLLSELSDPEVIRRIVEEPVPDGVTLENGVVDRLVQWWEGARSGLLPEKDASGASEPALAGCGLLHLQALLWAVRTWASSSATVEPRTLTVANLEEYAGARQLGVGPEWGGHLMADALQGYVEDAIAACEPGAWRNGPRQMLARSAGHLSSAGFKVPQPLSILISRVLQEEVGSSRSAYDASLDLGSPAGRSEAAKFFADRLQIEGSGAASDLGAEGVAAEMIGSLNAALDALAGEEGPNILRRYSHNRAAIYELVHDGFAPALSHWADGVLEAPTAMLAGATARRGEAFSDDLRPDVFLEKDGTVKPFWSGVEAAEISGTTVGVVKNLKWLGLSVHHPESDDDDDRRVPAPVLIEDIVFRDCVFNGSVFRNASFRNVRFDNCRMRGVALIDCSLDDVSFNGCVLVSSSLVHCAFSGVKFDCRKKAGTMDYVSIEGARPHAQVEVRNVKEGAGLFMSGLAGGHWSLDDVGLSHFAFASARNHAVTLKVGGASAIGHMSLLGPKEKTAVEIGVDVRVDRWTDRNKVVPPGVLDGDADAPR